VTLRVGTTPGGDELLKDAPISTPNDGAYYGKGDAYVGSMRNVPGGHMPNYQATSKVYATLSVSSGTLGNGTQTNLTRGFVMAPARYVVAGRYLT
jgi:sugar lactone lactonase YvrE